MQSSAGMHRCFARAAGQAASRACPATAGLNQAGDMTPSEQISLTNGVMVEWTLILTWTTKC